MKTISQIAEHAGKTKQAAIVWRRKAEEKYGVLPFTQEGKSKVYNSTAIERILEFNPDAGKAEPVEVEALPVDDQAPKGGLLAVRDMEASTIAPLSIQPISIAPSDPTAIARAESSLESRHNLNTAVNNLVQVIHASGGVGGQLGAAIGDQVVNAMRNAASQRINEGTKNLMAELGLESAPPQPPQTPPAAS